MRSGKRRRTGGGRCRRWRRIASTCTAPRWIRSGSTERSSSGRSPTPSPRSPPSAPPSASRPPPCTRPAPRSREPEGGAGLYRAGAGGDAAAEGGEAAPVRGCHPAGQQDPGGDEPSARRRPGPTEGSCRRPRRRLRPDDDQARRAQSLPAPPAAGKGKSHQEGGGAPGSAALVILGSRHGSQRDKQCRQWRRRAGAGRRHQRRRHRGAGCGHREAERDQTESDGEAARPAGQHAGAVELDGHAGGGAAAVPGRGLQHRRVGGRDHGARRPLHGLHTQRGGGGGEAGDPQGVPDERPGREEARRAHGDPPPRAPPGGRRRCRHGAGRHRQRRRTGCDPGAAGGADLGGQGPGVQPEGRAGEDGQVAGRAGGGVVARGVQQKREQIQRRQRDASRSQTRRESPLLGQQNAGNGGSSDGEGGCVGEGERRQVREVLLDMLEDYGNTRKEKEQERKRQRDQRRLLQQVQGAAAAGVALPDRDVSSPVARPPPKNIKNVTRTLSMGGNAGGGGGGSARKVAPASSRPGTPSFLKSPMSARRGGSDEGQMMSSDSFE
ncbi:uncharacterized protein [Miscanthus floridulus]|uniref:uncharacterized protein isoform X3 n=1 Tax=Miscanthus floridulus TaxID=154761 RepID=UPI0034573B8A